MTIEFRCPECDKLLRTADDKAGLQAKCPDCGSPVTVPAPVASEVAFEDSAEFDVESEPASSRPPPIPPAADASAGYKPCPVCGEQIKAAAVRCRYCGEMLGPPPVGTASSYLKPHRGPLILTLSIISWFTCFLFGIAAWVMAREDLRDMQAGVMDPAGESLTSAGRIVAMIHVIFSCVILLLYLLFFVFVIVAGIAAG